MTDFSRLLGKSTHFSFIQRANAKCSMTLRFLETLFFLCFCNQKTSIINDFHIIFENQSCDTFTASKCLSSNLYDRLRYGRYRDFIAIPKAHSPISVKLSGKVAKSKFLSILNALLPIYVTDGGIFTCSNFSQVLKALFSIIFNCAGNITFLYDCSFQKPSHL